MTTVMRMATPDDAATIAEIYAAHVLGGTGTFEEVPPTASDMAGRMEKVVASGLPWLVACEDGRVVGYAYLGPYHHRSAYRFTLEDSIYVSEGCDGRGIGGALLGRLIEIARHEGYRHIFSLIGDSANRASIKLHERAGFRHVGTAKGIGFKFNRPLDVVYMQLSL